MLTKEQIESNKNEFLEIISKCEREGMSDLIEYIKSSDFFEAPASTKYHSNFIGGLCFHTLNVYKELVKLRDERFEEVTDDSIIIAALLHDLAKMDYYEQYVRNEKVYGSGSHSDELGKFEYVPVKSFKVRDVEKRDFAFGEHGTTSFLIANKFIKLTDAEAAAIINHHANLDNGKIITDISEIYERYPLASMLHIADLIATYILEDKYLVNE